MDEFSIDERLADTWQGSCDAIPCSSDVYIGWQFISSLHPVTDPKTSWSISKCLELHLLCMEVIVKEVDAAYDLVRPLLSCTTPLIKVKKSVFISLCCLAQLLSLLKHYYYMFWVADVVWVSFFAFSFCLIFSLLTFSRVFYVLPFQILFASILLCSFSAMSLFFHLFSYAFGKIPEYPYLII